MGSNTSTPKEEETTGVTTEVALFVCDLIRESEPPFKSEKRVDHSSGALRALISWDKFMDDPKSINLKAEGDLDKVWTQKTEETLIKFALASKKTKLSEIRFCFHSNESKKNSSGKQTSFPFSTSTSSRKRAVSTVSKPKTKTRRRSLSNVFTSSSSDKLINNENSIVEGTNGNLEPMSSAHSNALLGGNILHCAALHGAVRLLLWAVQETSLTSLLTSTDSQGLTPLSVSSKELANLMKPFLLPITLSALYNIHQNRSLQLTSTYVRNESFSSKNSLFNGFKSTSSPKKSSSLVNGSSNGGSNALINDDSNVLNRSRRYHAIIQILRGVDRSNNGLTFNRDKENTINVNTLSGLAICIASGSPFDSNLMSHQGQSNTLTWPNFANNFNTKATPSMGSSSSAAVSPESSNPSNFDSDDENTSNNDIQNDENEDDEDDRTRNFNLDSSLDSPKGVSNQLNPFQQEQEGYIHNNGSATSPRESNSSKGTSTISSTTTYKTYHITDISCYFNFYKFIAQFEMKMTSDGHLALDGFADRFYSPLMYEACGWALQNGISFKCMVSLSNDGLDLLLKPLLNTNKLQHVDLSKIGLNGKVPHGLGHIPSLTYIDLHENHLTGSIPAAAFGNLAKLKGLNLSCNSLNGAIPSSLFRSNKLCSSLWYLNLHTNYLTESIPSSLCSCINLKELWLCYNSLKGKIPEEIGSLIHLECLFLNNNDLHGQIPNGFSKLMKLKSLYLQENKFTGTFPKSLLELTNLKSLSLRNNLFKGKIPLKINKMSNIERLHLGNNLFTGQIPSEFGDLKHLRHLFLDHNKFTGSVPCVSLSQSMKIQTLCLYGNAGLLNKGRTTKEITNMIYENKAKVQQNQSNSQNNNNNNQKVSTMGTGGPSGFTDQDDEETFIAMSKVNVTLLMINPNAPYSDDAENWRV